MLITRRNTLLGSAALGASVPLVGARAAVDDVPTANVKPLQYKPEPGASLHILRPAKFVDPDETIWRANTKKFSDTTGVEVKVDLVGWEDIASQTAVVANTGAGADVIVGFGPSAHIYQSKLIDLTELGEYLGAKYGGWYQLGQIYGRKWGGKEWLGIPMGGTGGPAVYRQSWVKEAGYDHIPRDLPGFLDLCTKLQKIGHPSGFSLGHAVGDGNAYAAFLLWSHGAYLVDEKGKIALDSKETQQAMKYAVELQKTLIPGTLTWNDVGNNQAYTAGQISLTQNGVSLYYSLKNSSDPALKAIAADTMHEPMPLGVSKVRPETCLAISATVFKHTKFPNAAKEYIRFMMEAEQYGPWLEGCLGYWCQPLKAYSSMKFWQQDPKLTAYATSMDTPYYHGYKGPISAAAAAVLNNYTLVDMFASVVTGNTTPQEAAKLAARQAERYYKTA